MFAKQPASNRIFALCLGYPKFPALTQEQVYFRDQVSKDLNLLEYNIVMIRDPSLFVGNLDVISQMSRHEGVISIGFLPHWNYYGTDGEFHDYDDERGKYIDFLSKYRNTLLDNLATTYAPGSNISFVEQHWAGKLFKKFEANLLYGGYFELTPQRQLEDLANQAQAFLSKEAKNQYLPAMEEFAVTPGNGKPVGALVRQDGGVLVLHPLIRNSVSVDVLRSIAETLNREIVNNLFRGRRSILEEEAPWRDDAFPAYTEEQRELVRKYGEVEHKKNLLVSLTWVNGEMLETLVGQALEMMNIKVKQVGSEKGQRDLIVVTGAGEEMTVEVKGLSGAADLDDVSKFLAANPHKKLIFIVNHYRRVSPSVRRTDPKTYPAYTPAAISAFKTQLKSGSIDSVTAITTLDLIEILEKETSTDDVFKLMETYSKQLLDI